VFVHDPGGIEGVGEEVAPHTLLRMTPSPTRPPTKQQCLAEPKLSCPCRTSR
jgi:hypothetical protein